MESGNSPRYDYHTVQSYRHKCGVVAKTPQRERKERQLSLPPKAEDHPARTFLKRQFVSATSLANGFKVSNSPKPNTASRHSCRPTDYTSAARATRFSQITTRKADPDLPRPPRLLADLRQEMRRTARCMGTTVRRMRLRHRGMTRRHI